MALTKVSYSMIEGGYVSVLDYGADPTGATDSLAKINAAGLAATAENKTLYFPQGIYGITDVLLFADGANVYFDPGATIKLLNATAGGGAVGISSLVPTKFSQIINLTVDCNNILGENGFGFTHPIGAYVENVTVKNCYIDWNKNTSSGRLGGKGLQSEGGNCRNVMINGVTIINCSFGIDIGGEGADNAIGIAIYNVKMENVSSPFLLKDTSFAYPRNNYDTIEVLIEGVSCRNCGDASDIGTVGVNPVDGGIIVCDRAYGVTIRNMQVVNDTGLSGTTAYPGIGGLVRGTVKSLILDDVLFVTTTSTAVFNFNFQGITPAATYDIDSYVNSKNVRVHANVDYVVSTKSGATIGAAEMSVEIGSTGASLAGIVDANAGALSTAMLQVIDRDQTYYSTGYRKLSAIYGAGNQLTGANGCIGAPVSASPTRSWTPVVTALAGSITTVGTVIGTYSVVGNLIFAFFDVTITTNGTGSGAIQIAGLPIASAVSSTSGSGIDKLTDKALQLEHSGDFQFLARFYDGTYPGANGANFVGCYIYAQG